METTSIIQEITEVATEVATTEVVTEATTEVATTVMSEMEMLTQINSNLVMIGQIENLILGVLIIFLLYGMYKCATKFFSMFI